MLDKSAEIMDLISSYSAYVDVSDLNVSSAVDPPATSPFCISASVSAVSGATYEITC